jgi:hypothetical protein
MYIPNNNKEKNNVLHVLAMNCYSDAVQQIFIEILQSDSELKGPLCQQNANGETPCHLLMNNLVDNSELISMCKQKGCDLTIPNNKGESIMTDRFTDEGDDVFNIKDDNKPKKNDNNIRETSVGGSPSIIYSNPYPSDINKYYKEIADMLPKTKKSSNYNSEDILKMLMNSNAQTGGKKSKNTKKSKKISGFRHVKTYSEFSDNYSDDDEMSKSLSRSVDNKSNQLHDESLEKIKKILKDLEPKLTGDSLTLKARAYKAIIYSQVKESHPTVSNVEKAQELLKESTEENIKKIKKTKSAKLEELEKYLTDKDKERSERTPMNSESDKNKKSGDKNMSKKPRKNSSDMSGGSSTDLSDDETYVTSDRVLSVVDLSENY